MISFNWWTTIAELVKEQEEQHLLTATRSQHHWGWIVIIAKGTLIATHRWRCRNVLVRAMKCPGPTASSIQSGIAAESTGHALSSRGCFNWRHPPPLHCWLNDLMSRVFPRHHNHSSESVSNLFASNCRGNPGSSDWSHFNFRILYCSWRIYLDFNHSSSDLY